MMLLLLMMMMMVHVINFYTAVFLRKFCSSIDSDLGFGTTGLMK